MIFKHLKLESMKRLFLLAVVSFLMISVQAESVKPKDRKVAKEEVDTLPKVPIITFEKTTHDYGNIYQGENGDCYFVFKNTGKAELILTNCSSSCGCTVPQWPREPIAPGQKETIKVTYDTKRIGRIQKQIYVDSNAGERITLTITGNISAKPTEAAPEETTSPIVNPQ
jgi:hypothetical protein